MLALVWGMLVFGVLALLVGVALAWPRVRAADGVSKVLVLAPVFEAVALAMFAAEHFWMARGMTGMVPKWMPGPSIFWVWFVGFALLAAAVSLVAWRCVRWAALLLAMMFLIFVASLDLPNMAAGMHDRFFWILTVRETTFACGLLVLAGSLWGARALMFVARVEVGCAMVFYGVQHFLHPHNVPGVPLENMIPAWMPAPTMFACGVGAVLLLCGVWVLVEKTARVAAAVAGVVLVGVTVFFYVPLFVMERHTPLALEGMNYIGDTLLFAATVMLVGLGMEIAGREAEALGHQTRR